MDSTQTLHDFVLNLLTNPDARSAFDIDPEGSLHAAGLSDLTPADVQDVVPLVVDYAPVQGITALTPIVEDLGLGALDANPAAVIGQLQTLTDQLTVGTHSANADLNVTALSAISVDQAGLSGSGSVLSNIGVGTSDVTADLSVVHDVAGTLDLDVLEPITGGATGTIGTADDLLTGTTGGLLGDVDFTTNTVNSVVGDLTGTLDDVGVGGITGNLTGTLDSVGVGGITGNLSGNLDGSLDSVGVGGITGDLGLTADADASTDGGLLGLTGGLF